MADDELTRKAIMPEWMTRRERQSTVVELSIDEAQSFSLFAALDTQWRRHPIAGSRTGIIYPAIRPTADMLGVPVSPALLDDIRVMEGAALVAFAEAERRR